MLKPILGLTLVGILSLSLDVWGIELSERKPARPSAVLVGINVAEQTAIVDRGAAAARVRAATGGRVLGVRSSNTDGRTIYLVKVLLLGGHVRVVAVDAQTGQLLD